MRRRVRCPLCGREWTAQLPALWPRFRLPLVLECRRCDPVPQHVKYARIIKRLQAEAEQPP